MKALIKANKNGRPLYWCGERSPSQWSPNPADAIRYDCEQSAMQAMGEPRLAMHRLIAHGIVVGVSTVPTNG